MEAVLGRMGIKSNYRAMVGIGRVLLDADVMRMGGRILERTVSG